MHQIDCTIPYSHTKLNITQTFHGHVIMMIPLSTAIYKLRCFHLLICVTHRKFLFQFTGEVLPNDDELLQTVVALDQLGDAMVMPETHLVFKLFPFIRFLPGSYGRMYRQLMENKRQLRELIFHETKVTFVVVAVVIILFVCLFLSSSFFVFCLFVFLLLFFLLFCFVLFNVASVLFGFTGILFRRKRLRRNATNFDFHSAFSFLSQLSL